MANDAVIVATISLIMGKLCALLLDVVALLLDVALLLAGESGRRRVCDENPGGDSPFLRLPNGQEALSLATPVRPPWPHLLARLAVAGLGFC